MSLLPPHYMLYGYAAYQKEICEILDENGYSHISTLEENVGIPQSKMDSIFIITNCCKHAYSFPSYPPLGVYRIMDMQERQAEYSTKELQNLVNMIYGDEDATILALNMFSKMNMTHVDTYASNIVDGFWRISISKYYNEINPYLTMLQQYSHIRSNKTLKREWTKKYETTN